MRYRPFGNTGKAVSAISLLLHDSASIPTPTAWRNLIFTALENGINCFEIVAGCEALDLGLAAAVEAVERRLLFLSLRICGRPGEALNAETLSHTLQLELRRTGAGYFDGLTLDGAAFEALTPEAGDFLSDARAAGLALHVGVASDGDAADACIGVEPFETLATVFNLTSDWRTRRRIKEASEAGMVAIGYDPAPAPMLKPPPPPSAAGSFFKSKRNSPLAGSGTYAFMHETPGWTAEEICLAYALTEPSFATLQIECPRIDMIERLAAVTDRDLPTGLAAQIEMARFGASEAAAQRRA